jgi:outer membrane protein TolC
MGLPYLQITALEAADGFPSLVTELSTLESRLTRLIELAMQRRPDLKAAQQRQDSARTLTGAAQTNLKPQLDVTVSVGYAGLAEGGSAGAIGGLNQNRGGANIGTSISYQWPFDNNVARGRYRQQAAAYDQSTIRAASMERSIGTGVESALSSLARSALQLRKSEEAVELYRISLENEKTKYKLSISTMLDVLTINDRLLSARLSSISYQLNTFNALAQLNFQTGALLAEDKSGQSIRLDQLVNVPKPD